MKLTMSKTNIINITIMITLFCTYIFPSGLIDYSIPLDKTIFTFVVLVLFFLFNKKFTYKEIIFILFVIVLTITSKSINYLLFVPILFLKIVIKEKEQIKYFLKKSNILYICLIFTLLYSIINFGYNGRYAFTAIMEINQSGLAIFCLGLLLMIKNKTIGNLTLIFGLLTFSRSYYLAFILYLFSKTKLGKKISKNKFIINNSSYFKLTIISTILLVIIGFYYIEQYKLGNIFWGDELSTRLFNFLDYSNLFRFVVNIAVLIIFYKFPKKLLFGLTDTEYIYYGKKIYNNYGIPYKYNEPHNLFLSHLKKYGFFSIIEIIYVSNILKKIIDEKNYWIYISVVLYSIFLGAGLYSYWLYLSVLALIVFKNNEVLE